MPALLHGSDPPTYAYRGLRMLPDGTLLGQSANGGGWSLLHPGATAWCAVGGITLPDGREGKPLLEVIGDRLWWLTQNTGGALVTVHSTLLNSLRCA